MAGTSRPRLDVTLHQPPGNRASMRQRRGQQVLGLFRSCRCVLRRQALLPRRLGAAPQAHPGGRGRTQPRSRNHPIASLARSPRPLSRGGRAWFRGNRSVGGQNIVGDARGIPAGHLAVSHAPHRLGGGLASPLRSRIFRGAVHIASAGAGSASSPACGGDHKRSRVTSWRAGHGGGPRGLRGLRAAIHDQDFHSPSVQTKPRAGSPPRSGVV